MAIKKFVVLSAILAFCAGYASAATPSRTSGKATKHGHHRHGKRKGAWKKHGQQGIQPERAMQIQQALIRENYLAGEPTGVWDARTQTALVKYQADNGWQTKKLPDSRALIKLGLGPSHADLLNPDTAFIAQPQPGKGGAGIPER